MRRIAGCWFLCVALATSAAAPDALAQQQQAPAAAVPTVPQESTAADSPAKEPSPASLTDAATKSLDANASPDDTAATATEAAPLATSLPPETPAEAEDRPESAGERESADRTLEPPDPTRRQAIEERVKSLDDAGLPEDDKKRALEFYQQAIKSFDVATQQIEAARNFKAELERTRTGKQSTDATAAKLAAAPLPYEDVSGEALAQVEKRAELLETSLAQYREELAAMLAAPKRRSQRMAELPKQISEAQQKLKQAEEDLAALASEDAADAVAAARRSCLELRQTELTATLYALQAEQTLYEQSSDWVTVRRDYFARYVPYKEKRLAQLRDVINRLREQEAQEEARLAAAAAEIERPKAIRDLAIDNKDLAEERSAVAARMAAITDDRDAAKTEYTTLSQKFASSQQQAGELSYLGGQLLRDQQAKLPNVSALRRQRAARESTHSDLLLRIYDLYDQSSELANIDDLTDQIAARSGTLSAQVRAEVRQLLAAKRETLERLIKDYEEYSRGLSELHGEETKLIELVEQYGDFIAERVLWIRSCSPPARADGKHALAAISWSLDPHNWRDAGESMGRSLRRDPAQYVLVALGLIALVAAQRPARRHLREYGAEARRRNCTKLAPTIYAVGLTALLALPWPAMLALVGWSLDSLNEHEFGRALGTSIQFAAVCLLLVEISRHLCRPGGLADAHFDWPDACLLHTRRKLRWLVMLGLPPVLWLVGLETQTIEPSWSSSLGRALFVATMLLLAATLHRLLLAKASPFRQVTLIGRGSWLAPLQIVWRPAAVLLPAALAVLATVGYYYTAQQAAVRILQTVGMLLAVLVLGGVTRRWLLVSRRRLAREQAKQRRAQLAAAADDDPGSLQAVDLVDDAVDLAALSEQTQKLVRTFLAITLTVGLVLIWGEILPALKYPAKHLLPGAEVLTWGDLAAFVLVLAVTYIAVRDVPALLELLILQHLPLDSGSRYAFTTMTRYALTAVGLTAAFNSLGGEWAKIQWLVAAMSVGLGFGLQEIFANFVSGIILLFERPIRVGDVVTLGDKTGVVNRIRMRSTTIVDPDRKEYIVPNKDLVTERLLNWTLTDYTNRVEVIANVASNTDTDLACALLLEAAREQPHVMREPAPSATFEGFSETGLKLALRCFLPNLDNRGSTIHGLHTSVDRKFRAAGIEGAFGDMRIRVTREAASGAHAAAAVFAAKPDAGRRKGDADRQGAA
jgi:potassium-dependent mechanosensitive channel